MYLFSLVKTLGKMCLLFIMLGCFRDHAVSCMRNGINQLHQAAQDWLLKSARSAGITCSREAELPDKDRPADVLFHNWSGDGPLAVDLTVSHPLRPSEAQPTPEGVRKSMIAQEDHKCKKYSRKCAQVGWGFMPLAIHPFGGLTPTGTQFLHRLS